ncbi:NAD(P)/FAD-dependent oxidoreductase [Altererythrobacter sp. GH1-8]|uniref:NAD(P)/FAD-dependent oxidoreductase n=1 Tax=Altererythrobacter sp. GH1-8 TaxID=3349333 RepID=UPI00374CE7C3
MDERHFADTVIIGAGMAGLACATALTAARCEVRLLDKGRGPGGRMATRRAPLGSRQLRFDHGAQYFTARDPRFIEVVEAWHGQGVVAPWPAAGEEAWVGAPAMNTPIRHMAEALDVTLSARAESIAETAQGWAITTPDQTLVSRNLVIAIPPEQVKALLADVVPDLAALAGAVRSSPCWAVMAMFDEPLGHTPDCWRDETGPISWAARNGAKPGRDGSESWVIQASPGWSEKMLELEQDEASEILLAEFFSCIGIERIEPQFLTAHRWRYAMPQVREGEAAIWDRERRIGLAGDWLHSPRVEGAFLSGCTLADAIIAA